MKRLLCPLCCWAASEHRTTRCSRFSQVHVQADKAYRLLQLLAPEAINSLSQAGQKPVPTAALTTAEPKRLLWPNLSHARLSCYVQWCCREEQASQGAAIVLRTLTGGARAIFRMLADRQLAGGGDDDAGDLLCQDAHKCCLT